jgi:hypothetical protein
MGAIPGRRKRFSLFSKTSRRAKVPRTVLFNGYRGSFPGKVTADFKPTSHRHLLPDLRMTGSLLLVLVCAFIAGSNEILNYMFTHQKLKDQDI